MAAASSNRIEVKRQNSIAKTKNLRPVIYQLFPRLFANATQNPVPNGRIQTNGSGKMNNITSRILKSIRELGITHIWYTGVIEHAHDADYTRYGIEKHNAHIIKGRAGSPYAICDYYDIDPDISEDVNNRMHEFEQLVQRTTQAGMGTIIDFVPNHVSRIYHSDAAPEGTEDLGAQDNKDFFFLPNNNFFYITRQQFSPIGVDLGAGDEAYREFPARATGNDCYSAFPNSNDWYETVKLNYGRDPYNGIGHFAPIPDTWYKMLHILLFWARKGISGFRCDMAHMVPVEFWQWAIRQVKAEFPHIIFIAEIYDVSLYHIFLNEAGFDYLYDKVNLYDTLRGIECSNVSAALLTSCWQTTEGISEQMLNFLENHDEQRFASDFFAGDATKVLPYLVAITTMSRGAVMVYNGQEFGEKGMDEEGYSGLDGRTSIFDYWSMDTVRRWLGKNYVPSSDGLTVSESSLRKLYSTILHLVNDEKAIREGLFFDLMYVNYDNPGINPHHQFAYFRKKDNDVILIVLNFSETPRICDIIIPQQAFDTLNLPVGVFEAVDLVTQQKQKICLEPGKTTQTYVSGYGASILKVSFPT
ncbi:MAG: alpha-amylase [Muribaculaceae bacterium]|nr:alpha-amylase [Muribaculaceae bacterium]